MQFLFIPWLAFPESCVLWPSQQPAANENSCLYPAHGLPSTQSLIVTYSPTFHVPIPQQRTGQSRQGIPVQREIGRHNPSINMEKSNSSHIHNHLTVGTIHVIVLHSCYCAPIGGDRKAQFLHQLLQRSFCYCPSSDNEICLLQVMDLIHSMIHTILTVGSFFTRWATQACLE